MNIIYLKFFLIFLVVIILLLINSKNNKHIDKYNKNNKHIDKYNKNVNVHLILYSNGEPFNSTKEKTIKSVQKYCSKNVIIHSYNLDIIKKKPWFKYIKDLPKYNKFWKRDGYYNCWKAFIIKDVLDKIQEGEIIYYVDCSKYYLEGFKENFDLLCDITQNLGFIAGSVGNECKNFSTSYNLKVWNKIYSNNKINNVFNLFKSHVLNSWFIFEKNEINHNFINEWVYWSCYKDDELKDPLVTYSHTVDQSIFNILVYKYNFYVFYDIFTLHYKNKDKNLVNKIINSSKNPYKYFIKLN